jgi:UDP-N-acetylglucosamine 1-carboxyvinyltransferase
MEKIIINGGIPLHGTIEVGGTKNAALAIIMANLLIEDTCVIENLPVINDVSTSLEILRDMGLKIRMINKNAVEIDSKIARGGSSPLDLVRKIRASSYLMGAELGRYNHAYVGYPGGCDLGVRAIDQHIKGFEALGATVEIKEGYVDAAAPNGLKGSNIYFDKSTVGGTINVILAAVKAKGNTVIENAAREPHVVDLANFLNTCGAKITGAGTDTIKVKGVDKLHGCNYTIIPDMIEAGTYMIAAAATGGELKINNVIPKHLESVSAKLEEMGAFVEEHDDYMIVKRSGKLNKVNINTLPYPGFPTDLQSQMSILMCLADGVSYLTENIFDNRFKYVEELKRMGASIKVNDSTAIIEGGKPLSAAQVVASDLRAGAALIIAGLTIAGKTEIEGIHHIERGYDNIVGKLRGVGADIKKVIYPDKDTAYNNRLI